jgi:G:T-mismatch repair DNA endonuclease (very short patch repair protein)
MMSVIIISNLANRAVKIGKFFMRRPPQMVGLNRLFWAISSATIKRSEQTFTKLTYSIYFTILLWQCEFIEHILVSDALFALTTETKLYFLQ